MTLSSEADVIVIGGGVVGLSCAISLARSRKRVALLERHARLGLEGSSRNSGVVHAGIHHPQGWLTKERPGARRFRSSTPSLPR